MTNMQLSDLPSLNIGFTADQLAGAFLMSEPSRSSGKGPVIPGHKGRGLDSDLNEMTYSGTVSLSSGEE